ncbi:MAG: TetR/AcrR family transcriptional regulator [Lentisphaeria bacterium]|nr:TetR/AcrR family transcriptional regulator [Lentisphaeria bacterium]
MAKVSGKKTRQAFIAAAGQLFAEHGIANVNLSQIASKAGTDASMINYHFGGKEGLIQAVIEHALSQWHTNTISDYYQNNQKLLESRDGQAIFVSGLVDCVFKNIGNTRNPAQQMLLQLLQHPHPLRNMIIDKYLRPGAKIFCDIYARITGNADFNSAFCWYMFLICPKYLYSACPGMIDLFHPEGQVEDTFDRSLQFFTTKLLLNGLGLV